MTFRRIVLFFIVSCSILCSCNRLDHELVNENEEDDSEYVDIQQWFEYLCSPSLGGRYSGSSGIEACCDFICGIIDVEEDSLEVVRFVENGISFRNIIFHIEGKTDSTIVFGAHYDAYGFKTKAVLPGADDNGSGVAVLLCLVEKLKRQKAVPKYCIDVCFWDGEEIGRYGSRHYVNLLDEFKRKRITYINIDTVGSETFYQVTLSYFNPSEEFKQSINSLASELSFPVVEYNPIGFTTDCAPFLKSGISFVNICCDRLPYYLHNKSDVVANISTNQIKKIATATFDKLIVY